MFRPLAYNSYDCEALEQEYARLVRKSQSMNKQQDDVASNDTVAMGVGMVSVLASTVFH